MISEKRDYFGFDNIFANDSIQFRSKDNEISNGQILNWFSNWSKLHIKKYLFQSIYS